MRPAATIGPTRRAVLAGSVCAAARVMAPRPASGGMAPIHRQVPGLYRFRIGLFELTAINDGVWNLPIDDKFVPNVAFAQVQQAISAAFIPTPDHLPLPFTALLVNTGARVVLIDTGTGGQI